MAKSNRIAADTQKNLSRGGKVVLVMSRVLIAEYDKEARTLRLAEPLAGFDDHASVRIVVEESTPPLAPWAHLKGSLSKEAGDSLAEAIDEMFPMSDVEPARR
jgi:hypothetical protein